MAQTRIRSMDLRYVEEIDPVRQYLLEVYVYVALRTTDGTRPNRRSRDSGAVLVRQSPFDGHKARSRSWQTVTAKQAPLAGNR